MSDDEWNSWNGENWLQFSFAAAEVRDRLGLTLGAAERTLRQLCASGVVRAIRLQVDKIGEPSYEEEPIFIAHNEWSAASIDHLGWVEVSENDPRYWLDNQGKPKLVGKQPRIKAHLAELFPNGVPDPAQCPRKALKADLLKRDPSLKPLDEATLKSAINEYNRRADPKRS
jgi:hypothetical protein